MLMNRTRHEWSQLKNLFENHEGVAGFVLEAFFSIKKFYHAHVERGRDFHFVEFLLKIWNHYEELLNLGGLIFEKYLFGCSAFFYVRQNKNNFLFVVFKCMK